FGRWRLSTATRRMAAQADLAALDVVTAAAALWILLPAGTDVPFAALFVAYLAALTVGLLSNAPGGLGAFEATLLLCLPETPAEAILAGALLFRAIYHGAPFLIALALLGREELRGLATARARPAAPTDEAALAPALAASDRAESRLALLGDKRFLFAEEGDAFVMYGARAGALAVMGDPVGARRRWPELIDAFLAEAAARRRAPVLYKIGPAAAALARVRGLAVDRIGHEAEIDPQAFDLSTRPRRQLRRKVAQARKKGLKTRLYAPGDAPLDALAPVDAAWRAAKTGGEAGFSMGRFAPDYLSRHAVMTAEADGAPTAFVSLWTSGDGAEWSIDLMRADPDAPQGAMQTLIVDAIEAARAAGADRFNLCMAPLSGLEEPETPVERLLGAIYEKADRWHGLKGLRRFKAAFDPEWRPRYVARPKGPAGLLAPVALRLLVARPPQSPATAGD
ncbi:MAG: phosphatidylglycerol lysyltransferase domain-containing protein, partial [Pseudomonadota bacterium]